ncbi:Uncharacterised protein [uncultured archaeon]|nr:Uncharacterised protein [uncultured archaeon]
MKYNKLISIIFIILLAFTSGCVETPTGTPTPPVTPTATMTLLPTAVPTSNIPIPTPPMAAPGQVKYIIWMDSDYGFYRIRAVQENHSLQLPSDVNILNFTINLGDKVRWMNDDSYDFTLTLVSNEGLWTGSAGLTRYQGEHFEYIFNKTGTYTISIREYPLLPNQTIIVKQ